MKKTLALVLSLIMAASILAACGSKHSHGDDPWTADLNGHYQTCEDSGKRINEGKHTLDDSNKCTKCGATLHAYSPIGLDFVTYNKYGLIDYYIDYFMGKESVRYVYEYVYEEGEPVSYTVNEGNEVYEEGIVVKKDGEYERLRTKRFYDDYNETRTYYEDGLLASHTEYDKKGKVLEDEKYTYEKDSKGNLLTCTCHEDDIKTGLDKYALDEDGNPYICESIGYYDDGTVKYVEKLNSDEDTLEYVRYKENGEIDYVEKYEYVYDEKGEVLSRKVFLNDEIFYEYTYRYVDYEYAYPKTTLNEYIHYSPNGEKYIDVYDDFFDIVLSKVVDSDGVTISETKNEHTRDELGRVTSTKGFEDGVLTEETVYEYDGDSYDWIRRTEIEYYSDGGKEVTVCNDDYDTLSYTEYDADGEIVTNETYEYEYNENGDVTNEKTYSDGALIKEERYSYDEEGNLSLTETYEDGVLTESRGYVPVDGGVRSESWTQYYSDGGKRVINYLENGSISLDIYYNADGSYGHYFKYTVVINDDGTETTYTYDENGTLIYEFLEDENGMDIEWIEYHINGKTVRLYDEDGDFERELEYDKGGNLTSEIVYGEDYNVISETLYYEGGKTVYTHNGDGTVTCQVYDKDGNLISTETIE